MLATRTHLPPLGQGSAGYVFHADAHSLASRRHWNSSMSKTAIGTTRGLTGAHPGTQLPVIRLLAASHEAPGSFATRAPTPESVGPFMTPLSRLKYWPIATGLPMQ